VKTLARPDNSVAKEMRSPIEVRASMSILMPLPSTLALLQLCIHSSSMPPQTSQSTADALTGDPAPLCIRADSPCFCYSLRKKGELLRTKLLGILEKLRNYELRKGRSGNLWSERRESAR